MTIYHLIFKTADNVTDANVTANTVQEAMRVLMDEDPTIQIVSVVDTDTNQETIINRYDFWSNRRLQDWYHIEITTTTLPEAEQYFAPGTTRWVSTRKEAYFCSRIHVNKRSKIGADSYSGEFTDAEILKCNYLSTSICQKYGADLFAG